MSKIRGLGYLLAAFMAAAAIVNYLWNPPPPAKFLGLTGAQVPINFGAYHGSVITVDPETQAALPSADIIERQYIGPNGESIAVTIIGGVGRNQLHDPRSCLVGAGWQIVDDHVEQLPSGSGSVPVRSCQALIDSSDNGGSAHESEATDIMYLYVVNRHIVASASSIRWTLLTSDLLEQTDEPVYYVRTLMTMPLDSQGVSARFEQHRELKTFTAALWNELSPTIYRGEKS